MRLSKKWLLPQLILNRLEIALPIIEMRKLNFRQLNKSFPAFWSFPIASTYKLHRNSTYILQLLASSIWSLSNRWSKQFAKKNGRWDRIWLLSPVRHSVALPLQLSAAAEELTAFNFFQSWILHRLRLQYFSFISNEILELSCASFDATFYANAEELWMLLNRLDIRLDFSRQNVIRFIF